MSADRRTTDPQTLSCFRKATRTALFTDKHIKGLPDLLIPRSIIHNLHTNTIRCFVKNPKLFLKYDINK